MAMVRREPTCWLRSALDLIGYAQRRGASREPLLALLPAAAAARPDPEQRIAVSHYYAVVEGAARALGDPLFGISYIEQVQPAAIDAVGFLAAASRTLGEALGQIVRHHRWITHGDRFGFFVEGDAVCFRFDPWGAPRPAHDWLAQMYAADCLVLAPRATGAPVVALSLALRQSPLAAPERYAQRLGATPRFCAERDEWWLSAEVLGRPMIGADPGLVGFFTRYLELRAGPGPAPLPDLSATVRQLVCESLPDGVPTLAMLARRLGQSPRSLQRRLADEGGTLTALVDDVRLSRAQAFLGMGLAAAEASQLLGFTEPAAFARAFRRWTGQTPGHWRAQAAKTG